MIRSAFRVRRSAFTFGRAVVTDWRTTRDRPSDPARLRGEPATRNAERGTRNEETL